MNIIKFYGLLGNQNGIQMSLTQSKLTQLKKNKYVKIKNYIYEAASVFQNNGIYYANLNYISNPDVFGIDVSKVLNIWIKWLQIFINGNLIWNWNTNIFCFIDCIIFNIETIIDFFINNGSKDWINSNSNAIQAMDYED